MPIYTLPNGDRYDIPEDKINRFLEKFPEATVDSLGKITPLQITQTGAVAKESAPTEIPDMGFQSENTLLESQNEEQPSIIESLAAKTVYGITDFLRGTQAFAEDVLLTTTAGVADVLGNPLSTEEKMGLKSALAQGVPGSMYLPTNQYDSILSDINEHVRETENTSVTQAIENGNYAEAAELAVGGALQSLPSVAMAFTGAGGLAVFGSSVAGNKFDEEFKNNPEESLALLALNAAGTGATEALFERTTMGLIGKAKGLIGRGSTQEAAKILKEGLGAAGKRFGLGIFKESLSEGATEGANMIVDAITLNKDIPEDAFYRVMDGAIIGGLMGGSINTVAEIGGASTAARNRAEFLLTPEAQQNQMKTAGAKISNLSLDLQKADGEAANIIREEINKETEKIIQIKKANSLNINAMNKEQLMDYAKNIDIINKRKSIKGPPSAIQLANNEIKKLTEENNEIISLAKEQQFEKTAEISKKQAKQLGIDFQSFETKKDLEEYLVKNNFPKNTIEEAIESDGFISKNGKQIFINKEIAKNTDAVNVASHELLHGLLFKTLKEKPNVAINLGRALGQEISKLNLNEIADSNFRRRVELYSKNPESIQAEEILTLFADATATGDIKYNENIFTRIGDSIRRVLQDLGFKKIKFDTGRDVYNFIKDYNKDISKGGIRQKVLEQAREGIEGKLVDITKTSQEEVEKFSRSQKASDEVQRIYEEQGTNGAMDIIDQFKPIVDKLVNKYRDVPGFEYELLKDEIETGKRGILDMIMGYTPEKAKGAPLAGYINTFLSRRAIEAANRILKTDFELDVTEAKGVTDTVTAEETIEREEVATEKVKKITLLEGLDTSKEVDGVALKEIVNESLEKNVALSVKKYNAQISKNRTVTPFVQNIKDGIAKDLRKKIKSFINQYGYEKFLNDNKDLILNNFTTTYLSKHPLFKKGIQKSSGGIKTKDSQGNPIFKPNFISPKQIEKNKYDWVDDKGKKLKIDRDSAAGRGLTSGPEIMRRDPKIKNKITENEFIDYHFKDGALRKQKKQNPEDALAMQIASELGFEYLKEDFLTQGPLFQKFSDVGNLLDVVIPETAALDISKDIDRGLIKFSKNSLKKNDSKFLTRASQDSGIDVKIVEDIFKNAVNLGIESDKFKGYVNSIDLSNNIVESLLDRVLHEGIIQAMQDAKARNNGIKYEKAIKTFLQRIYGKDVKVELIKTRKGDLKITVLGKEIVIELKLNKNAQFSSISFSQLFDNNGFKEDFLLSKEVKLDNKIKEFIINNKNYFNSFWEALKKTEKQTGLKITINKGGNIKLPNKDFWELARQNMPNGIYGTISFESGASIVFDLYKESGVDLIQIGSSSDFNGGMYRIGKINSFNSGYSAFNAKMKNVIRPTRNKNTIYFRLFPNIAEMYSASENSLETSFGINKLVKEVEGSVNIKASKSLNKEFNEILQATTGVKWFEKFSPVEARMMGKGKGKKFFIPYSADDFVGLLYTTLGTKKQGGNEQMEWYKENLLRPFSRGIQQYEAAKQNALREWQIIKKEAKKDVPGGLNKKNDTGLTNQDAVRIFIWNEQGMEIPGAGNKFINDNLEVVKNNPKLQEFAERLMALNPEGYPEPSKNWDSGDITTDIVSYINDVKRSEFLTEFKENAEEIFSDENKQKLRALYGDNYIEALDDILFRMTTGTNRRKGASKVEQQFMNWTNNSVGAIMFFNARSAVLQTLSAVNFINFSDNNPINAAIAFGKQKQYWNDFSTLFNSDFLKQRRTGLQTDVNADEIARAAKGSKNTARAALSALLKFGFTPTQIADSFAIASGGATFYRNRIKTYLKEGLTQKEAEEKAFTDFQEIAEETQQSARPDRISLQQASSLGRLVLAFANTPMQYARLTKKATLDLFNGRGDWKTNVSKIAYYSVIQNIIFSALQQGLFALLFDDEDDDKEKSRLFRIGNSSVDTLLRGIGVYGAAAATVKNMILEIIEQSEKSRPDYTKLAIEATSISPPINSKLRKLESAGKTFTYKQSKEKVFTQGFSLENPAFLAGGKVLSAATNLPADRVVQKADHIYTAMQSETELWQSLALALGWSEWDLGMIESQTKKSKTPLRKGKIKRKNIKRKSIK